MISLSLFLSRMNKPLGFFRICLRMAETTMGRERTLFHEPKINLQIIGFSIVLFDIATKWSHTGPVLSTTENLRSKWTMDHKNVLFLSIRFPCSPARTKGPIVAISALKWANLDLISNDLVLQLLTLS